MRIIYLHQYFNTPQMSGGTRSYEMARRLVAKGHEVNMITTDQYAQRPSKWYTTNEEGIVVHWLPLPYSNHMSYSQRIRAFFHFSWKAAIHAAAISCDVVFATSTPLTIALPAVYASRRQKVPMVFEVRDLWPELPIAVGALKGPSILPAKWLEQFAYQNASRIVALSPGMKVGILQTGYPEPRIAVIPNSSDVEFFDVPEIEGQLFRAQYEWLKDRPLVLYAGTLGQINGVDYLVQVAAKARNTMPELRFLVIGDGAERHQIAQSASRLGLLNKTFFMFDSVPKQQMPAIFSAADISTSLFIDLPAMWNNSANKFFDALAAGKPIAINYQGWQAELLTQALAGIVLPVNDHAVAAHLLTSFINDKKRLQTAARAARSLAIEYFHRDKMANNLEQILVEAAKTNDKYVSKC